MSREEFKQSFYPTLQTKAAELMECPLDKARDMLVAWRDYKQGYSVFDTMGSVVVKRYLRGDYCGGAGPIVEKLLKNQEEAKLDVTV